MSARRAADANPGVGAFPFQRRSRIGPWIYGLKFGTVPMTDAQACFEHRARAERAGSLASANVQAPAA